MDIPRRARPSHRWPPDYHHKLLWYDDMARYAYRFRRYTLSGDRMGIEVERLDYISSSGCVDGRADMGEDRVCGTRWTVSVFDGQLWRRNSGGCDLVSAARVNK